MHEFKDTMEGLKQIMAMAKLAEEMQNELDGVRFCHENTMTTLKRVIAHAEKIMCPDCRGEGYTSYWGKCDKCDGCGEVRYDPHEKDVEQVMRS